ncbi:MAG: GFA family protein [Burkholderiales bacterium]|jgi:hypothetical protein|nr:GFA family protein [Burkholderiales bacterium]
MPNQDNRVHGSCYCGKVAVAIQALPQRTINCHCGQCRRLSGAAFTTWLTVERTAASIEGIELLSSFRPTENVQRWFCSTCGSHVYSEDGRLPRYYGFPAGIFDEAQIPEPSAQYFVSDKAAWYQLSAGTACFGGPSGMDRIDASPANTAHRVQPRQDGL